MNYKGLEFVLFKEDEVEGLKIFFNKAKEGEGVKRSFIEEQCCIIVDKNDNIIFKIMATGVQETYWLVDEIK